MARFLSCKRPAGYLLTQSNIKARDDARSSTGWVQNTSWEKDMHPIPQKVDFLGCRRHSPLEPVLFSSSSGTFQIVFLVLTFLTVFSKILISEDAINFQKLMIFQKFLEFSIFFSFLRVEALNILKQSKRTKRFEM